ncbi:chaplin [Streptomyces sp. S186]|uniref:chaplin n=1 Tax=Streptomyces sp. S186 TaxID=3434395 RepID=UPI003F66F9F5
MNSVKKAALVLATTGLAVGAAAGSAFAHGHADGKAVNSPGVGSGNVVQSPVRTPANIAGNSANVVGVLNSAFGNPAVNN